MNYGRNRENLRCKINPLIMKKEEAEAICSSKWWMKASNMEIVEYQLYQEKLCMPFDIFIEVLSGVLNHPVSKSEIFYEIGPLRHEFEKTERGQKEYEPGDSIIKGL